MDPFVHLHVASGYSMQYGASHPHTLVERAAEQDEPVGHQAVHEVCVRDPVVLLADAAGVVPARPVHGGQREVRHAGIVPGPSV